MICINFPGDLDYIRQAITSLQEQQKCRQVEFVSIVKQQKQLVENVDQLKDCITDVDITTNQINSKLDHLTNIRPGDIDITAQSDFSPPNGSRSQPAANQMSPSDSARPTYVRRRAAACSLISSGIEEES